MNETEWLTSTDPTAMLRHLTTDIVPDLLGGAGGCVDRVRSLVSDRKLRLFAGACWRPFSKSLHNDRVLGYALRSVERWADTGRRPPPTVMRGDIREYVFGHNVPLIAVADTLAVRLEDTVFQADLLRHILGNPFRRPTICGQPHDHPPVQCWDCRIIIDAQGWLIGGLAEKVYGDDQPAAAVLHDALLDAAAPAEFAGHFREPTHPKGCWALDLILGRA